MSIKIELLHQLKEIGYELGRFTSKDTLTVMRCLHDAVLVEQNINVAKLTDGELRASLIQRGFRIGPVTNHTRAIYQRKLLEVLANQAVEERADEDESDENDLKSFDYENREPTTIRHDCKSAKPVRRNSDEESHELRHRAANASVSIKNSKSKSDAISESKQLEKKGSSSLIFIIITVIVALAVFFGYLWLEK